MSLKPDSDIIGNFLLFQLLWLAAVLGAAYGSNLWAVVALGALVAWTVRHGFNRPEDLVMLISGVVVGTLLEQLWMQPGILVYALQPDSWMPPVWILALWAGFALSLNYSFRWLRQHPVVALFFGGAGGALSMAAGVRLGAAQAPQGMHTLLLLYGAAWALIVPLLGWWSARLTTPSGRSGGDGRAAV